MPLNSIGNGDFWQQSLDIRWAGLSAFNRLARPQFLAKGQEKNSPPRSLRNLSYWYRQKKLSLFSSQIAQQKYVDISKVCDVERKIALLKDVEALSLSLSLFLSFSLFLQWCAEFGPPGNFPLGKDEKKKNLRRFETRFFFQRKQIFSSKYFVKNAWSEEFCPGDL